MATDATTTIVPGHGTLFIAPVNTAVPATPLTAFGLATVPAGWDNLGHTSKDNLPAFTRDGGDKTSLDTWLADAVGAVYASTSWSLGFNSVQVDKNSLDLSFNGSFDTDGGYIVPGSDNGIAKALFLLMTDGTGKLGFYIPNTLITLGDSPSIDPTKFFELPISASILSAASGVIPAAANGIPGIMKVYKNTLAAAVATITTALPSGEATGEYVNLIGTGFTGTTGITIGGVAAPGFVVVNDNSIFVPVPSGSAGSAPIIVTGPYGASVAKAYTRA